MSFGNVADFQGDYVYKVIQHNTDILMMNTDITYV